MSLRPPGVTENPNASVQYRYLTARSLRYYLSTGIEYVPVAASPESHRMSSSNPGSTDNFIVRERAIAKGGTCTIIVNYHMKATVNANGDVVVSIEKITVECPNQGSSAQ